MEEFPSFSWPNNIPSPFYTTSSSSQGLHPPPHLTATCSLWNILSLIIIWLLHQMKVSLSNPKIEPQGKLPPWGGRLKKQKATCRRTREQTWSWPLALWGDFRITQQNSRQSRGTQRSITSLLELSPPFPLWSTTSFAPNVSACPPCLHLLQVFPNFPPV